MSDLSLEKELLEMAGHDPKEMYAVLNNPEWGCAMPHQDWRNHVPPDLAAVWDKLSHETRACIYLIADYHALAET